MSHVDILRALEIIRPGAKFALSGDTYGGLVWLDNEQTKPTEAEITGVLGRYTQAEYADAIQRHIDAVARERQYDGGISCVSYMSSTNPQYAAEAIAFNAWRDSVWLYAYAELAKATAGDRPSPSVSDFIAELPEISWPA